MDQNVIASVAKSDEVGTKAQISASAPSSNVPAALPFPSSGTTDGVPDALPFPSSSTLAWGTSNTPIPGAGTSTRGPPILTEAGGSIDTTSTIFFVTVTDTPLVSYASTPTRTTIPPSSATTLLTSSSSSSATSPVQPSATEQAQATQGLATPSHTGVIAGASVAAAAVFASIFLAMFLVIRRQKRKGSRTHGMSATVETSEGSDDLKKRTSDREEWPYDFDGYRPPEGVDPSYVYSAPDFNLSRSSVNPSDSISEVILRQHMAGARSDFSSRFAPNRARHPTLREESEIASLQDGHYGLRSRSLATKDRGVVTRKSSAHLMLPELLIDPEDIVNRRRASSDPTRKSVLLSPEVSHSVAMARDEALQRLHGYPLRNSDPQSVVSSGPTPSSDLMPPLFRSSTQRGTAVIQSNDIHLGCEDQDLAPRPHERSNSEESGGQSALLRSRDDQVSALPNDRPSVTNGQSEESILTGIGDADDPERRSLVSELIRHLRLG